VNGPRVFVHRSPGLAERKFTIRDLSNGQVSVVDEAWLADATFEVAPAGRLRALREHRRTVHAGIFGTLLKRPPRGLRCDVAVRYQPSRAPYFLSEEHRPVLEAPLVHLVQGTAYIPREERWL